ncbi:hypothetical protein [Parashewanella tropica]|uniref:hypothetical protein n=1 Tax=Parashewanella tropica TaxID=2547970 RepID=UPI0010594061|nr:hypothetical protein [Parashewanella tropica]
MAVSGVQGVVYWGECRDGEQFYNLSKVSIEIASQNLDENRRVKIPLLVQKGGTGDKFIPHKLFFSVEKQADQQQDTFIVTLVEGDELISSFLSQEQQSTLRSYLSTEISDLRIAVKKDHKSMLLGAGRVKATEGYLYERRDTDVDEKLAQVLKRRKQAQKKPKCIIL